MKRNDILHKQELVLNIVRERLIWIQDNKHKLPDILLSWQLSNLADTLHYLYHSYHSCSSFVNCCDVPLRNLSAKVEEISDDPWHIDQLRSDSSKRPLKLLIGCWNDLKNHSKLSHNI